MAELTALKCNTCLAAFSSSDAIKDHYRGDWHCFNSKRRAQGLPILRREQFLELVKSAPHGNPKKPQATVPSPNSSGSSSGKATTKPVASSSKSEKSPNAREAEPKKDENFETAKAERENEPNVQESIDETASAATVPEYKPVLGGKVCVFDDKTFETAEECAEYMTLKYGFFFPDYEYLEDLEGMIEYMNEKVKLGGTCLYCQKRFENGRSCQHHMISKSHCKIAYDEEVDGEEYEDFYDFSSTYEDIDDLELDENGEVIQEEAQIASTGELVLPDGRILGHREFRVYYKQYYRPQDTRDCVIAQQREELLRLGTQYAGGKGSGNTKLQLSDIENMSDMEVMSNLIKYQKSVRKGQIVEQKNRIRQEAMHQRREYASTVDKIRSSETTTAKIRDWHRML